MEEALVMVLKNDQDIEKICRQEPYWKEKKRNFFFLLMYSEKKKCKF
jgi:hypothetical protein